MKKILLSVIVCGLFSFQLFSQVANYTFNTAGSTYTEITGGTLLGSASTDDQRFVDPANLAGDTVRTGVGFPIGFNLNYHNVSYDRLAINANGWISLGQSTLTPSVNMNSTSNYAPISATSTAPAALQDRISGLATDLQGQAGSALRIETIGTSPNQSLVIQWKAYRKYGATGDSYNFQIRLYETTNIVELAYGTVTNNATPPTNLPQVGLRGDANTDYNNRTSTTSWASSNAGTSNTATMTLSSSVHPSSGLVYRFTPPVIFNYDAGIVAIINPVQLVFQGNNNFNVTIKNFGSIPLTTATIAWKVDGSIQTPFSYINAGLILNATDGPIYIGNYNFTIPGFHTLKVWTEDPNANPDQNNTNDTTTKIVFVQGYAPLPFLENFDGTWINKFDLREVPGGYWNNTPMTGNNSWRRDDDGTAANWLTPADGAYSPEGANGTNHSARFHTYYATNGQTGVLDLNIDFTTPGVKILQFWYINPTGSDSLDIYISHDGGLTFSFLQQFNTSAGWTSQQVTLGSATNANSVLRFKATSDYLYDDIGIDQVEVLIMQPDDAGISAINAPDSPVSGITPVDVTIKNFGTNDITAATIDWTVNGLLQAPFSYVNGTGLATGISDGPITIGNYNFSSAGYYTIKVWSANPNGSSDGNHNNDTISKMVYKPGFATIPFMENFDAGWMSISGTNDVPSIYWNNTPASGNNSWRRDDDGVSGAWTGAIYGAYSPEGASGTDHSARFHTYSAPLNSTGILDLYLDFSQSGSKELQFWYNNTSGFDTLDIYLSEDNGVNFNHLQQYQSNSSWTQYTLPLGTSTGATTILRFKATSDYGYSDIGLDEVHVYFPPDNDVGVTGVLSPEDRICGNANDSVIVLVHNFGVVAQTNIPVIANIVTQGGPVSLTHTLAGPLNSGETDTLYLGNINTLMPFIYNITAYTDLASDMMFSNDTVYASFTISDVLPIPHIEDFEGSDPLAKWNTNFQVGNGHGNTSNVLYSNLYTSDPTAGAVMTQKTGPVSFNSVLTFDYRITNWIDGSATILGTDSIVMLLSSDCGTTFEPVYHISASTHVPSTSMKHIEVPLGLFAGNEVMPAIYAELGSGGDYYLDFDNIVISDAAIVDLGPDQSICAGSNIVLDAGAAPTGYTYSYEWSTLDHVSPFTTTQTLTTDSAATYIASVDNGFGVITTDTIVITVLPLPIVSLGMDVSACGSYMIDAGAGFDFYLWSNAQVTESITVNTTDTYTVTVTDNNGCTASDDILVTITPLPTVSAGPDQTLCNMDTLHLMYAIAANFDSLLWTSSGDGHFNDSTLLHANYIPGSLDTANGSVNLTVTAYAYCDTISSVMTFNIASGAVAFAGDDVIICSGGSVQLGATGGSTFLWSPAQGLSNPNIADPIASPVVTTTYTVQVTGSCGTANDSVKITIHSVTPINLGNDTSLCSNSAILDAGAGYDSYLWSSSDTLQTIAVDHSGEYFITATDNAGCSVVDSINIIYLLSPVAHVSGDILSCNGQPINLYTDTGFVTYVWPDTTSVTNQFTAMSTGNYWVNVTGQNGCSANSDTLHVGIFNLNDIYLGPDVTIHLTEYVILDAGHGYAHYSWNLGANTQTLTIYGSDLGIGYHVVGVSAWIDQGCYSSDSITIHVINNVGINELAEGESFNVYPNPASDFTEVNVPSSWSNKNITVNLTDIAGRNIKKMYFTNVTSFKINVAGIAPGVYQVIFSNGSEQINAKLIIQ